MADPGRTGPNDERRQSDLSLGSKAEKDDRFRMGVTIILSEAEVAKAVQSAVADGYQRENPNWAWTQHERKNAVRHWLLGLIVEDLNQ